MTSTPAPKVAVIDDERHLRELLELGLGEDGFEVRSAADGQSGLTLVREWRPDAIILDVMLPYVNGLELLPMMRRVTEAPILMLSAKADTDDRVTGLLRGADDYIPEAVRDVGAGRAAAFRAAPAAARSPEHRVVRRSDDRPRPPRR